MVDEEKVDDLNEFYKLDNDGANDFVTISGQYRRGRNLQGTEEGTGRKFTRFLYSKTDAGFEFIDDDSSSRNFTVEIKNFKDLEDIDESRGRYTVTF